jgi:hypothetical protein
MSFFASWLKNGFWRQITILLPPTVPGVQAPPKQNNNNNNNNKNKNATCEVRDVFLFSCVSELCYSPPFPCLTVAGRERGAGTSSTGIVVRAQE